jgi:hypothetical protein
LAIFITYEFNEYLVGISFDIWQTIVTNNIIFF